MQERTRFEVAAGDMQVARVTRAEDRDKCLEERAKFEARRVPDAKPHTSSVYVRVCFGQVWVAGF